MSESTELLKAEKRLNIHLSSRIQFISTAAEINWMRMK
jgi:hypothetical protein